MSKIAVFAQIARSIPHEIIGHTHSPQIWREGEKQGIAERRGYTEDVLGWLCELDGVAAGRVCGDGRQDELCGRGF